MNLRSKNERLQNNLNSKRKINERMMKSQFDMNKLKEKNLYRQRGKVGIGYKEDGESSKQGAQRNKKPTCNHYGKIGHTSKKCWSNRKRKFNEKCYNYNQHGHRANECKEKPKFEGKCYKCKKHGHKSLKCKTKILNLVEKIMKATFGWDYNTWCRCHYYGEFGHIGMNCVKHHMRTRDTIRRCFICTDFGHLAKNCINTRRMGDEKKEKDDNIRKKMRQKCIPNF